MPRPLLYAQFEDSKYTPQFVGSIYPELKEAQQVLNQRYDTAQDQDSKTAAALTDLLQNTAEKDLPQARAVYDQYLSKLEDRAKSGRYETMLPDTVQDARKFNVNATKFIAEKKRIDDYLKRLDENKEISNSEKARLRQMAMSNQASLQFNPKTGAVEGQGFREDAFAKDVNLDQWANKMSEGFIPDQTSWNGGKFVREKDGSAEGRLMFIERGGTKREVKPQDVRAYVSDIAKSDSDVQGYLDRLTKQAIHDQGGDWRNPDPQQYQEVRAQIEDKALSPTMRAMGNKFGFKQTQTSYDVKFDPMEPIRARAGKASPLYNENERQLAPSTTKQDNLKNIDLTELTKDRVIADEHSGVDPLGMNTSYKKAKGKTITELASEAENGLPKYPGLKTIASLAPKGEKESEQDYAKRINPLFKSYQSKINTHQAFKLVISKDNDQYTNMVFGPKEQGEDGKNIRTGGGYFSDSPIWIERDGKFTEYQNGNQALKEGAISSTDLSRLSVVGFNHNYGDFGGAYEANGVVGGKPAKIYVGASTNYRKYSEPLQHIERQINTGEEGFVKTQILTNQGEIPIDVRVIPLDKGNYEINNKGEFSKLEPQVEVTYPGGQTVKYNYKDFKTKILKNNPYADPIQAKSTTNEGTEEYKQVRTEE